MVWRAASDSESPLSGGFTRVWSRMCALCRSLFINALWRSLAGASCCLNLARLLEIKLPYLQWEKFNVSPAQFHGFGSADPRFSLLSSGSLNVKTADGRCIRFVSCTTRSSGRLGESSWLSHLSHASSCWLHWKSHSTLCLSYPSVYPSLCLSPSRFICENCLKKNTKTRKENKFTAKRQLIYFIFFPFIVFKVLAWGLRRIVPCNGTVFKINNV